MGASWCCAWLNAVHPFKDGNGRGARGLAYLVGASKAQQCSEKWSASGLHARFHSQVTRPKYLAALQHANNQCGICKCCRDEPLLAAPTFQPAALHGLSSILQEAFVDNCECKQVHECASVISIREDGHLIDLV